MLKITRSPAINRRGRDEASAADGRGQRVFAEYARGTSLTARHGHRQTRYEHEPTLG